MKKASKLLALCLALLICTAFAACQSSPEKAVQETPTTEAISVEEESPVTEETTAIEATTAAFKPVVVREAPEFILPDLSENPDDIKREDGTDGEIIVPYTLSTDEILSFPEMKGSGELDGSYFGAIRHARDHIIAIDIYEYVVYHKEDIQKLQFGDKILFEDELLTVNGTMFEHEDTKMGNVTIMLEGCQSPFGRGALYVTPQYADVIVPNEDYCVDYSLDDMAYRTYVRTIEVELAETIDFEVAEEIGEGIPNSEEKQYTRSEFIKLLDERSAELDSIYNQITIYNDKVWQIRVNSYLEKAMNGDSTENAEVNKLENNIVAGAVNPAYSIETLQELRGQSADSAALNYRGCVRSFDGNIATIDIYKTDFYKLEDLQGIQPGDSIVINNEVVKVNREYNSADAGGSAEVVLDQNGNQYVFKKAYGSIPDYCLTPHNEPYVSYYKTIDVELSKNVLCVVSRMDGNEEMTFEEIYQFLQNDPTWNIPQRTDILLLNGKLFGYAVSDTYNPNLDN